MRRIREVSPPTGLRRLVYRLPIAICHWHLGRLLGSRFLLLEHCGRRSGEVRETVLEVIHSDRALGIWYVVSAWGDRAQWLLNLRAAPRARIKTAGRTVRVDAREVSAPEAELVLLEYGGRHPRAARSVARLLGWEMNGSEQDLRAFASVVRVVELTGVDG